MSEGLNRITSQHAVNEFVDVVFPVTPVSASLEGVALSVETTPGSSELEGPQEVVGLLEVLATGVDFVDNVLNGGDVVLGESLLDDVVVEGNALLVDLSEAALENQLADGLARGVPEGDVWLHFSEHVHGGLVESYEHAVVELS